MRSQMSARHIFQKQRLRHDVSFRYIVFPKFEKWFPRHALVKKIDALVAKLVRIPEEKEQHKGNDFMTYMLEDVSPWNSPLSQSSDVCVTPA